MKRKNFTMVPNAVLSECQISISARLLLCILFKYTFQKDHCWPSQKLLAQDIGLGVRQVRNLLTELENEKLIDTERSGWNRNNTYTVDKNLKTTRVPSENDGNAIKNKKQTSSHLRTLIPIHTGTSLPTKNTYGRKRVNKGSSKGLESLRQVMIDKGLIKDNPLKIKKADF